MFGPRVGAIGRFSLAQVSASDQPRDKVEEIFQGLLFLVAGIAAHDWVPFLVLVWPVLIFRRLSAVGPVLDRRLPACVAWVSLLSS